MSEENPHKSGRSFTTDQVIALCRPGFENDCANELLDWSKRSNFNAYIRAETGDGFVQLISAETDEANVRHFVETTPFDQLIFTRQWFAASSAKICLPEDDRTREISNIIGRLSINGEQLELDYPDTNFGRGLSKFCNQFRPHLEKRLSDQRQLSETGGIKICILFLDSTHCYIGFNHIENSAVFDMGIPRLRMPSSAPSRSTLKLEEAFLTFLDDEEQQRLLRPAMKAVDLGAAPGGWTWQLVRRQMLVTAVDNGDMDARLLSSGMVDHIRDDGFTFSQKKTSWLVCDMVEQPHRVAKLIASWLKNRWCRYAIANLKLPMKKRYETVKECEKILLGVFEKSGLDYSISIKQLYHDREEVTLCILTNERTDAEY